MDRRRGGSRWVSAPPTRRSHPAERAGSRCVDSRRTSAAAPVSSPPAIPTIPLYGTENQGYVRTPRRPPARAGASPRAVGRSPRKRPSGRELDWFHSRGSASRSRSAAFPRLPACSMTGRPPGGESPPAGREPALRRQGGYGCESGANLHVGEVHFAAIRHHGSLLVQVVLEPADDPVEYVEAVLLLPDAVTLARIYHELRFDAETAEPAVELVALFDRIGRIVLAAEKQRRRPPRRRDRSGSRSTAPSGWRRGRRPGAG
jgi:hypothetical protein